MEIVNQEKLKEINQAALNETSKGLDFLIAELMREKNLRADQVEIIQEVTPSGIKMFVQQKGEGKPV